LSSGTKIAEFNINGTSGELYAPQGGTGDTEIFYATYGSTSFSDIKAAIDSGKTVIAVKSDTYGYLYRITSSYVRFITPSFYETSSDRGYMEVQNMEVRSTGWTSRWDTSFPRPTSPDNGKVLTATWNSTYSYKASWQEPSTGSEVDIIPSLQTGTKIADYVIDGTSGELYAPDGGSTYTAGDNISIQNDEISVSGTAGLIAGDNISITASGENYVISSTGGGGGLDQVYHDAGLTGLGTSESPLSITSADIWNAAAGMNEYPISAGPGMSIEDVDGVTVFSCNGGDVPDDVVTSGQLATVSGEIMNEIPDLTGYATQTWVSDGFMETSGLEYNSQDEISGYNGHPVMTVDSEKQWLTHDDTIAHVTNSAQYAFGVNVPVVAQAMGMDETVLFTASAALDNISTSEVVTNFERLRIELQSNQSTYVKNCVECIPDASHLVYACTALIPAATYPLQVAGIQYNSSNGKDFTFATGTRLCYKVNQTYGDSSTTTIANSNLKDVGFITKIVGIGRKEN
jgi:hypothetical protein